METAQEVERKLRNRVEMLQRTVDVLLRTTATAEITAENERLKLENERIRKEREELMQKMVKEFEEQRRLALTRITRLMSARTIEVWVTCLLPFYTNSNFRDLESGSVNPARLTLTVRSSLYA